MLKSLITQLAAICFVLSSVNITAEPVAGLYVVAVPVDSQSNRELVKATKSALKTVFIRVSGDAGVISDRQIAATIGKAGTFTRQFRYRQAATASGEEQLEVVIEFEQLLVDQALRHSGLPMWSGNRPSVLVWMVVEDSQGRRFVGDQDADIVAAITNSATRRGLPLKLPLLDLEDMVAASTEKLWQFNHWSLRSAIERYKADTVLLGRVSKLTNGQWLGRWFYSYDQSWLEFDGEAENINDYSAQAIDQVAQLLATKYAVAPVNIADGGILMRLTGINDFVDYARAISYLESVTAIHHANVIDINGNEIILRLVADGLLSQLQQAFALDRRLQLLDQVYIGDYAIVLDYNWPSSSAENKATKVSGENDRASH